MSDKNFKEAIWLNKDYFQRYYLPNAEYFESKGSEGSDKYYIKDENLFKWINEIDNIYNDKQKYRDEHGKIIVQNLKNDLRAKRGGQYSNGTLFSSSRLIAEVFRNKENRQKLLEYLGIKDASESFKWYLEYILPIKELKMSSHPAQLDLVAENDNYFIGIECKMKEIYSNYDNIFSIEYKNSKLLDEFNDIFHFKEKIITKDKKEKLVIVGDRSGNFYYKQQLCHYFGMKNKISMDNLPNKQYIFLNFVFDPSVITDDEKILSWFRNYICNEKIVMEKIKPYFFKNRIIYKGLITQKDILK